MSTDSPFLDISSLDWIASNRSAFAIFDRYPVSEGHALVVSRRLIPTWWEALPEERADIFALIDEVKGALDERFRPNGYNIGVNAGVAAGQTIPHLHVHLIPRYAGDTAYPEGGIRNVFPDKANYLHPGSDTGSRQPSIGPELLDSLEGRVLQGELLAALRNPEHDRIDLVVSFVMPSGVEIVLRDLHDALTRGAVIRLLTTGYLGITSPEALLRLLDLAAASPIINLGTFTVKAFEAPDVSFHPKGYVFWNSANDAGQLFVGSGNLSWSGLAGGVEWTLRSHDVEAAIASFEQLWRDPRSVAVDDRWVADYRSRRMPRIHVDGLDAPAGSGLEEVEEKGHGETADLGTADRPAPSPIQTEALAALEATRAAGFRAGLVVMATGLGKTWLAGFDAHRPEFSRVLFVAHRIEILVQARNVFRRLRPTVQMGFFVGEERHSGAEIVFATVQTLSQHLEEFEPSSFDYIVVDEFHHAEAATYRRVLGHFSPKFMLGLTATPERMDGADLLALSADNLVFRCDLVEGIVRQELVPFRYWGIPDTVDFAPIPWRNGRFATEDLEAALVTEQRADSALREWRQRAGTRTLGFCCSIAHAEYMSEHFRARGVAAAALHSQSPPTWRQEAVTQLTDGRLQILFTVDLFNEGVDLPAIDTVLFLRPTESPVVFLQQLGRGLRTSLDKQHLAVVDFVGNHQSFLTPLRTILSLDLGHRASDSEILTALTSGDFRLPVGCSIDYSLEAVDLLRSLLTMRPATGVAYLRDLCIQMQAETEWRPTALDVALAGGNPAAATAGWFHLLRDVGLLDPREQAVLDNAGDFLHRIQTTPMTRSFKMVTLQAMLRDGSLLDGVGVPDVAIKSREIIEADPRLSADIDRNRFPSLPEADAGQWERYWRENPIKALDSGGLFRISGDRLTPAVALPADLSDTFCAMVAEIVEWRLHYYMTRKDQTSREDLVLKVSHSSGQPIIRFDRARRPEVPRGEVTFMANGARYLGRFVQIALNYASEPDGDRNVLPEILRGWFGPAAGHPGTSHQVVLRRSERGWELGPLVVAGSGEGNRLPWFTSEFEATEALRTSGAPQAARSRAVVNLPGLREGDFILSAGRDIDDGPTRAKRGDLLLARTTAHRSGPDRMNLSGDWPHPSLPAEVVTKLDPKVNLPMGRWIGQDFRRDAVPSLFGLTYNPGNWQSGHVSLNDNIVLFVTLIKEADRAGADYVDRFEAPDLFHWTSQTSVAPDGKKGREVLNSIEEGRDIHLFVRNKRTEVAFTYCGPIVPQRHEGSRPMTCWFRLLGPLAPERYRKFSGKR